MTGIQEIQEKERKTVMIKLRQKDLRDMVNLSYCEDITYGKDEDYKRIMKEEGWYVGEKLLEAIRDKLKEKIPNLVIDSNDLLVDGKYKMISYASINANNRLVYTCVHISFAPDIEAIQNICVKPMNKIPKGLIDYGITHEEIINIVRDYVEKL